MDPLFQAQKHDYSIWLSSVCVIKKSGFGLIILRLRTVNIEPRRSSDKRPPIRRPESD